MRFLRHSAHYRLFLPSAAVLCRRHYFAFLVLAGRATVSESDRGGPSANTVVMSSSASTSKETNPPGIAVPISDGLLLYYDHFSFYSQKVVMALHEKNLPFESKTVDLVKSEQYKPWFLYLNPKGEVPVLQDTGKIIPDSGRIIDYLEDNFSNGNTPRLIPNDQGPEVRQKITHFRHLLQKVPAGSLTTGAVLHPKFLKNPKSPFFGPIRTALANAEKNSGDVLRKAAEIYPQAKDHLLKKADIREATYKNLLQESAFKEILTQVDDILTQIESELEKHKNENEEDWWLCSDRFTIADVELAILLIRISQLGLEHLFWLDNKRPNIEKYYARVQQRDSYKKTVPGTFFLVKTLLASQAPIIMGVVAAIAVIISGAVLAKKFI